MAAPTITSIGTYTTQITLNQSTFVQLKDAVKNAMTGLSIASGTTFSNGGTTGWDLVWEGKYDALSPHWTQVFRSLNVDGVTYKCSIFNWNIPNNELDICTCERFGTLAQFTAGTLSAMATTGGAITNPAWTFYNCATIGWKLDACDVIINAHPRWMLAHAYINSEPCLWAGVFELQRNDPMDTATQSNPCWGWISSTLWNYGINSSTLTTLDGATNCLGNSGYEHLLICMPSVMKYSGRVTGINAAIGFSADYGITQHPSWLNTQYSKKVCMFSGLIGNTNAKFQFNGWNPSKRLVMPITPIADYMSAGPIVLGQIYGLKVLGPVGENMNRVKLTVGSDGNFSTSGTSKDHFILNLHHKHDFSGFGSNTTTIDLGTLPANHYPTGEIITIGSAYFLLTRNTFRLYRIDAFSGATTLVWDITAVGYTPYCMRFDGEQFIYIGHSNGLAKIDVYSLAVTPQISSASARGITFLNGYVVFSSSQLVTSAQTVYKVDTGNSTTTFGTTGAFNFGVTLAAAETDFYGNVTFVGSSNGSYWSGTSYYFQMSVFSSNGSHRVTNPTNTISTTYHGSYGCKLLTDNLVIVGGGSQQNQSAYGTHYHAIYDSKNLTTITTSGYSTSYHSQDWNVCPNKMVIKHSGNIYFCDRWYHNNYPLNYHRITSSDPTGQFGNFSATSTSNFGILTDSHYYNAICTDGTRLIGPTGTSSNGTARLRVITGLTNSFQYQGVRLGQVAILA